MPIMEKRHCRNLGFKPSKIWVQDYKKKGLQSRSMTARLFIMLSNKFKMEYVAFLVQSCL